MTSAFRTPLLAALLAVGLSPASAQSAKVADNAAFDLTLKGLRAGVLTFSGAEENGRYSVSGKLQSAGLAAMIRKFSYTAQASGSVSKGRYTPASYSENADTGKRQSQSSMTYSRGVPTKISYTPARDPRPGDVKPSSMGGTVDPLTSLYATLRDVDAGQECKSSVKMFDGRRATQITLSKPQKQGENVVCAGEYRRLAGFSDKDMAEKTRFPFSLTYAPLGDGRMRVVEVGLDTVYGKATMKRR